MKRASQQDIKYKNDITVYIDSELLPFNNILKRVEFGCIGVCTKGYAVLEIDFKRYRLNSGMALSFLSMQTARLIEKSPDFIISYFTCSHKLVLEIFSRFNPNFYLFIQNHPIHHLDPSLFKESIDFLRLLKLKCEDQSNSFREEIVVAMIKVFYLDIYGKVYHEIIKPDNNRDVSSIALMKSMIQLLDKYHRKHRDVAFYADKLCVTPRYLSRVINKLNKEGAKEYIDNYIITELKLQLTNTTKTLQEITNEYTFPDTSSLSKYFKKIVGISPSYYRIQLD